MPSDRLQIVFKENLHDKTFESLPCVHHLAIDYSVDIVTFSLITWYINTV